MNREDNTWEQGDKLKFHDMKPNQKPQYLEIEPGLYWYCGLGCGMFFRPAGTFADCSPQEANAEARALGIEMRYVDSFINIGSATYVGD
jgi:hypothetical protein